MRPIGAAVNALLTAALLAGTAGASAIPLDSDVHIRALPNAPNGYTPANVPCPANRPTARSAATVSPDEARWLEKRRKKAMSALAGFFGHVFIPDFDAVAYIGKYAENLAQLPNIGIAVSGGGYRALMNGAGAIKAFDSRTAGSTSKGHLGGLLQSATYLSGLSGGGWLVGSLYLNNETSVDALTSGMEGKAWDFHRSIFQGPKFTSSTFLDILRYYAQLQSAVAGKQDAGYKVSITDYWGRALSYQFINAKEGGPSYTWSSISLSSDFQNAEYPMPIILADGRNPGEKLILGNATVFEFNPWEFGTFDPTIFGFVPLEYLGSKFQAGVLPSSESCVRGFDNAGYIMGTSSSLFNEFALRLDEVDIPKFIKDELRKILKALGDENNDIADYSPNPFYQYATGTSPFAGVLSLPLVDGGEDGQNIPLHPLIQPARNVDVIFAIDSSANTKNNWPNGSSLVATYQRSLDPSGIANGTSFPAVPDVNTFVNLGLNTRPTFFGCDSSNTTKPTPLVVYIPNYPYTTFSNISTFTLATPNETRDAIIKNGYDVATMGGGTGEKEWPTCVGCAILSRSFERTGTAIPAACQECFKKHCWDGTVNSATPADYAPSVGPPSAGAKSAASARIRASPSKHSVVVFSVVVLGIAASW
ncbi:Lysophospholipase 1 [Coccidioides immitis]|nr:Lysophospholipase 1 [Coccidioides immitis]